MSNELTNVTTNGITTFNFKNAKLNECATAIATIGSKMKDANKEIAKVLATIEITKCYTDDGFKNVGDFAEATFGIKKAHASQLASVARRFYNDTTPAVLAQFAETASPSNLYELRNMTDAQVEAAINSGSISPESTQKELREFSAQVAPKTDSEGKVKVIKTFDAVTYIQTLTADKFETKVPLSMVELDESNIKAISEDGEEVKVSNVGGLRIYVNTVSHYFAVMNATVHAEAKKQGKTKTAKGKGLTREELLAMLAELDSAEEEG